MTGTESPKKWSGSHAPPERRKTMLATKIWYTSKQKEATTYLTLTETAISCISTPCASMVLQYFPGGHPQTVDMDAINA